MTSILNPTALRKQLRQRRQQLAPEKQRQHAQQALIHLQDFLEAQSTLPLTEQAFTPLKVALFLSQDGELDTELAIQYLWQSTQYKVYLPVLETKPDWHMGFAECQPDSQMVENQFGIAEPAMPFDKHLSGQQLDIVLLPLVGFDNLGNRMGMGGGYYDRSFAFKKLQEAPHKKTLLIGWAHSCQRVTQLASQAWDIPLDGIITEFGFQSFNAATKILK
jgi:5-formyltetrahydrofolate cyclo-ligase